MRSAASLTQPSTYLLSARYSLRDVTNKAIDALYDVSCRAIISIAFDAHQLQTILFPTFIQENADECVSICESVDGQSVSRPSAHTDDLI